MGTYKTARNYKRAVICEEYIAITVDMMEAVILNQMICWSKQIRDLDQFVKEEQARRKLDGDDAGAVSRSYGRIYKAAAELKEEIMRASIRRKQSAGSWTALSRRASRTAGTIQIPVTTTHTGIVSTTSF